MSARYVERTPSTGSPTYGLPSYSFPATGGGAPAATPAFITPGGGAAQQPPGSWGSAPASRPDAAPLDALVKELRGELQTIKDDSWKFEAPRHQAS